MHEKTLLLPAADVAKVTEIIEAGLAARAEVGGQASEELDPVEALKELSPAGVREMDYVESVMRYTKTNPDQDPESLVKNTFASSPLTRDLVAAFLRQCLASCLEQESSRQEITAQRLQAQSQRDPVEVSNPRCIKLTNPSTNATVHVIGVMHHQATSRDDVQQIIREVQPDCVCVELCDGRALAVDYLGSLAPGQAELDEPESPFQTFAAVAQEHWGKTLFAAYWAAVTVPLFPLLWCAVPASLRLPTAYATCLPYASNAGEMDAAIQESRAFGVPCYAIDRDSDTTKARLESELYEGGLCNFFRWYANSVDWTSLGSNPAVDLLDAKLLALLANNSPWSAKDAEHCRELTHQSAATFLQNAMSADVDETAATTPGIHRGLLSERDEYLAHNLWRASQRQDSVTVAVVGASHVPGIRKHFGNTTDARFAEISTVPDTQGLLRDAAPLLIAGAITQPVCIAATCATYRYASHRFTPQLARCGIAGLGASLFAGAAYAAASTYNDVRRILTQMDPNRTRNSQQQPQHQPGGAGIPLSS